MFSSPPNIFYREICNVGVFVKQRLLIANIFYLVNYTLKEEKNETGKFHKGANEGKQRKNLMLSFLSLLF